jgi:hypothetical protein
MKKVFRDFTRLCDQWDLFGKKLVANNAGKTSRKPNGKDSKP